MSRVVIGDRTVEEITTKITAEMPDEWAPIYEQRGLPDRRLYAACDAMLLAWLPDATRGERMRNLDNWYSLLHRLVGELVLELGHRLLVPGHPYRPLDFYPPSEFHPDNFDIYNDGNLVHCLTGRIFHAAGFRIRRPPEPKIIKLAVIKPSPATVSQQKTRAAQRPGRQERRVECIYKNEQATGWHSPDDYEALKAAREAYRDKADAPATTTELTLDRGDRQLAEAWQAAQELRRNPQIPIREILRRIRLRKL